MVYLSWILFRILFSIIFLNAAWQCGRNQAGRKWTISESKILFGDLAPIFGIAGIFVMAFGGLSILFGAAAEVGGAVLAVFLAMGAVIHFRHSKNAGQLHQSLIAKSEDTAQEHLQELAVSAQLGHYSSAIKNISLMGPAIFFAFMGSGPLSIFRLWGSLLNG